MSSESTSTGENADSSPEAPEAPVSRRVSLATGLMVGAAVALVGTVGLLGYGGALPAVVGAGDTALEPVAWVKLLALPVGAFAVVWLVLLHRRVAWWARVLATVGTVAFLVVCGWLAWRGMPEPGPEFGLGGRVPWILAGCAVGVVAAAVYAAGAAVARRTASARPGSALTTVVAGLVVLVLAAAGFTGVRAAGDWTAAQNLGVARADGPLDGQRASTLDGKTRWQGQGSRAAVATRGGIVVASGPGIYAVDPTTGRQRWHYYSWGTSFFTQGGLYNHEVPVVSDDGRYIAVTGIRDPGLDPLADDEPSTSQVYVFDAVRGRLLGRFDVREENIWYVDGNVVVLDDARDHPRAATAYRHDGSRAWALEPKRDCTLGAVVGLGDNVLVGHNCEGTAKVSVRDATTGRERWDWGHEGYISSNGVVVPKSGAAAGTVLLDIPRDDFLGKDPGRHTLTALDADTGETRWSRASVRVGRQTPGRGYSHSGLYTAGTLVLVGPAKGDEDKRLSLVGVDPANGNVIWRRHSRTVAYDPVWQQDYARPSAEDQGLDALVGATAGRIVLVGETHRLDSEDDQVRVESVDASTGRTTRSTLLPRQRSQQWVRAVHVVGDTVALSLSLERYYLVGLG